jgi:hypothetical protein
MVAPFTKGQRKYIQQRIRTLITLNPDISTADISRALKISPSVIQVIRPTIGRKKPLDPVTLDDVREMT